MVGRALQGVVQGHLHAVALPTVRTKKSKSSNVPRSGWSDVNPPSSEPMAHGLPGSPSGATSELFFPLRAVCPMGWTGGRYRTSKPSRPPGGPERRRPASRRSYAGTARTRPRRRLAAGRPTAALARATVRSAANRGPLRARATGADKATLIGWRRRAPCCSTRPAPWPHGQQRDGLHRGPSPSRAGRSGSFRPGPPPTRGP